MVSIERRSPVQPGDEAPDFTLSAVTREGLVSLGEYRDRATVLVALTRGIFCPFCRRHIAQLGITRDKLQALGIEVVAVVATTPDNAKTYFGYRPARVLVAADPELSTHRAYGVPGVQLTPQLVQDLSGVKIDVDGALSEPLPIPEAAEALARMDGYQPTEADRADMERISGQLQGQFLVDRAGVVRWVNVECAQEGLPGFGKFPSEDALLAAARTVRG